MIEAIALGVADAIIIGLVFIVIYLQAIKK